MAELLASAGAPEVQRRSLLELTKPAQSNLEVRWIAGHFAAYRAAQLGKDVKFSHWLETATPSQLKAVTETFISAVAAPHAPNRVRAVQKGSSFVLKDAFIFPSIIGALYWMVWQDVYRERQFQFCSECRKLFQPEWRHAKKFCSQECAHRKTQREWRQRKRETKGRTNVTHKTR
jgi:hypothetical protein